MLHESQAELACQFDPDDPETVIIGCMLIDAECATKAAATFRAGDFRKPVHRRIFEVFRELVEDDKPVDVVIARDALKQSTINWGVGDFRTSPGAAIFQLFENVPTSAHFDHYADIVMRKSLARDAAKHDGELTRAIVSGNDIAAEAAINNLKHIAEQNAALRNPEGKPDAVKFIPVSATQLLSSPPPPIPWLVDGLVIKGRVTLLVAAKKLGKSLSVLQLASDLALLHADPLTRFDTHGKWLGQKVANGCPVLYLSAEGGDLLVHHRLDKMLTDEEKRDARYLHVYARKPTPVLADVKDLDDVFRTARAHRVGLIIIDPLGRFWNPEEESNPRFTQEFFDRIGERAEIDEIGVVIVDHDAKSIPQEVTGGRGSAKKGDCADIIVNLKREEPDLIRMAVENRWGEPPAPTLFRINPETLRLEEVWASEIRAAEAPIHYEKFVTVLRREGRAVSRKMLPSLHPELSKSKVDRYMAEWLEYGRGEVERVTADAAGSSGRGEFYRLTNA